MLKIAYEDLPLGATHDEEHRKGLLLLDTMLKEEGKETYRLETAKKGKLYLADGTLFFNISHTKGKLVCALCDREIGIDIERIEPRENALSFARRYFTETEQKTLENAENTDETFYEIWTKKEAYGKMLGTGIGKIQEIDTSKLDIKTEKVGNYIVSIAIIS